MAFRLTIDGIVSAGASGLRFLKLRGLKYITSLSSPKSWRGSAVAEWSKAPEFDAETGGESPVQAPVWAVTFSPYV